MLSATNDLASRLHQAIILSSEQHTTDKQYTTLGRTCKFILLCLQNIFNASAAEKKPEKAETNRLFGKQRGPLRGIMIDTDVSGWVSHMMNGRSHKDEKHSPGGRDTS
jgi:hypothetical protein